jgi:hypothetical protein
MSQLCDLSGCGTAHLAECGEQPEVAVETQRVNRYEVTLEGEDGDRANLLIEERPQHSTLTITEAGRDTLVSAYSTLQQAVDAGHVYADYWLLMHGPGLPAEEDSDA